MNPWGSIPVQFSGWLRRCDGRVRRRLFLQRISRALFCAGLSTLVVHQRPELPSAEGHRTLRLKPAVRSAPWRRHIHCLCRCAVRRRSVWRSRPSVLRDVRVNRWDNPRSSRFRHQPARRVLPVPPQPASALWRRSARPSVPADFRHGTGYRALRVAASIASNGAATRCVHRIGRRWPPLDRLFDRRSIPPRRVLAQWQCRCDGSDGDLRASRAEWRHRCRGKY